MRTGTAPPPPAGGFSPSAPFVQPAAPKPRRQPALFALGLALIGVSAAGFVMWNHNASAKTSVLVLARDVPYGQKLTVDDLRTVDMTVPDGVRAVNAAEEPAVLSLIATTALHAGSVLAPGDVGAQPAIPPGSSLISQNFDGNLLPAGLAAGRQIILVLNGQATDPVKTGTISTLGRDQIGLATYLGLAHQVTFKATVVTIDKTKLTLAVPADQASVIEELASEGRLGMVLPQNAQ
jgi:hypothetical protein